MNYVENQIQKIFKNNQIEEKNLFNLVLLQFCIIAKQDLESIYLLTKNKHYYTPQLILRSLFEYYSTIAYSLKDQKKLFNALKNKKYFINDPRFKKKYNDMVKKNDYFNEVISNWPHQIEVRANKAGIGDTYLTLYRTLSILVHPDARNFEDFFNASNKGNISLKNQADSIYRTLPVALAFTNVMMSRLIMHFKLPDEKEYVIIDNEIKKM